MEPKRTDFSRATWAAAAFVLFLLVLAVAAPRLTEEADREAGRLRVFEGLAAARAIAGVAEASGAKDGEALRAATVVLMQADPTIRRVFFISAGGLNEYGMATDREFVYDSQTGAREIGEADKPLLDQATKVLATAEARGPLALPVRELMSMGDAEGGRRRFIAFAPALVAAPAEGGAGMPAAEVVGVAGIVRDTDPVSIPPHLLYGVALALAGAFLFLLLLAPLKRPRIAFTAAALAVFVVAAGLGWWDLRSTQAEVAEAQAAALATAAKAAAAGAPQAAFDPELAWRAAWGETEAHAVVAAADGATWALADDVVGSRAAGRMVMPVAVLFIGLVLAWFAHRGTADLLRGIRTQPTTYAYIVPVFVAMGAVIFYPFLKGVEFAFLDASAQDFVGLANFQDVLIPSATSQSNFWRTLVVTVVWTVLNVSLHVIIGLFLALILNNSKLRLKGVYRVLLIVPWAVPNYITALTWKTMFNTQYGAVNILLNSFGIGEVNWFGPDFITNFAANLITNVWLGFPFMMVVSLGALQSIPAELYEAADIDGAGRWQKFRQVTLPLLKPALFPAIILGTIWTFNMFNIIYLVSGGGPDHKTEILITEAYYLFKTLNQYGLAAAYCLMIFLILLAYTVMTNRITKATEGAFE